MGPGSASVRFSLFASLQCFSGQSTDTPRRHTQQPKPRQLCCHLMPLLEPRDQSRSVREPGICPRSACTHAQHAHPSRPAARTKGARDTHHTVASCLALRIHAQDTRVYLATMSGQLETVKKIEPIYKSPDKWDTHLAMHVKRGMQGSWDKRKSKNALTPFECKPRAYLPSAASWN